MLRISFAKALVLVTACAPLAACSPTIRWPRLVGPGPAPYQRAAAEQIDPYPINDMGPPIVGGRPREFDKPRDEVRRSRQFLDSVGARAAGMPPTAPIPFGPPVPIGQPIPMSAAQPALPQVAVPQVRY
jgi:hypothetical protein